MRRLPEAESSCRTYRHPHICEAREKAPPAPNRRCSARRQGRGKPLNIDSSPALKEWTAGPREIAFRGSRQGDTVARRRGE